MSANPTLPVTYGAVGATAIIGNVNSATLAELVYVTLSANYARNTPLNAPGYPIPVAGQEVSVSLTNAPATILSGTRLQLFSDEAAALVTGGFAAYS